MQPGPAGGDDGPPRADLAAPCWHAVPAVSAWRRGLVLAALALGLSGLAASAAGIITQVLPRRFTAAQARQIMAWETARRWRTDRAGQIFPAAVPYTVAGATLNSGGELGLTARRLGIAPEAACRTAADRAAARVLDRFGCTVVLRATYLDSTGSMLVTVGVAELPSNSAATSAAGDISALPAAGRADGLSRGVRPVAYPGTLSSEFHDRQRQVTRAAGDGPYLIMLAAGFSDGRPTVRVSSDRYTTAEMTGFAGGVADAIGAPLGALPSAPHCPGAPGC